MLNLLFTKFQGSGNDFILIDNRDGGFPTDGRVLIQKMCHRQFGIGANGIILLCLDSLADFRMRIFNSDGCEASSCGNGLLCFVQFCRELGIIQKSYTIKTQEKIVEAFFQDRPVIDMGLPGNIRFEMRTEAGIVHCIDTGVPHAVQFVPDVEKIDLVASGGFLRRRLEANINFAALQEDGSIRVRTFERGVEGETLACGTGAAAVAVLASRLYGLKWPISAHFRGGDLSVWEGEEKRIFLSGPAEKVFAGFYEHLLT